MPRPITPTHTRAIAAYWAGASRAVPVMMLRIATIAPEELQMGDEMDSSMYLSPTYPRAMDTMYSSDTGR